MSAILIVEDEPRIAAFLEKGLRAAGFTTMVVEDGRSAMRAASGDAFDLVVLDLGLPAADGLEVLRHLRQRGDRVPVIVLTARSDVESTVAGLEGGADDYMSKPFSFAELLARIRLRLRDRATSPSTTQLRAGDLLLDVRTRRVTRPDGDEVELTAREFALAETLFRHPGQVLSREQLLDRAWGYAFDPGSNVVDVYVGYLRRKLGEGAIETVRGMGYRLRT